MATVELGVRDQCGFWYVEDDLPDAMSTEGPRPVTWDDFPPGPGALAHAEAAYGNWSYAGDPVGSVSYEWRRIASGCGGGALLAEFTLTTAGWYALDLKGARSEALLTHLLRVLPGPISAASTIDSLAVLGDPVAGTLAGAPFTARDEFGNALLTGGDGGAVAFASPDGDESFLFQELVDHGDGTYTLLFVPDRETPALRIDWTVDGAPSTSGGVTLAVGRPTISRAMFDAGAGSPGPLYGASAAALGGHWYMFGGVEGDGRAFGTQLWRLDRPAPGWATHYVNVTLPDGPPSELVRVTVDTTDPRIRPDCSDVRFTDAATSEPIHSMLLPVPGCGSTASVFLLRRTPASREVRMHWGNAAAPRAPPTPPNDFFDVVLSLGPHGGHGGAVSGDQMMPPGGADAEMDMPGSPADLRAAFNASGYWAGLAAPGTLLPPNGSLGPLPLALPTTFYAQFAFYDLGLPGAGRQLLELSDGNATVRMGIDTAAREGLYADQYIFQLDDARPFTIGAGRSRGWHSVELVAYADGSVGVFVDELGVRQIQGVVIAPTAVAVVNEGPHPVLFDAFRAVAASDAARPLPVLIGPSEAGGAGDALYADASGWALAADSAAVYGPPGRRGAALAAHDDDALFLFGGMRGASALNDLWSYTPAGGWRFHTAGAGAPSARYQASLVAADGKLYLYGGKAPGGAGAAMSDLWEFDIAAGEWYNLTSSASAGSPNLVLARFGHTAVVEGGRMLVFGGHTGAELAPNSIMALELSTCVWSTVAPRQATGESVPLARMAHAAALDEGVMYIIGGAEGATEFNEYGDVWAYEVANNRWFRMIPRLTLAGFDAISTLSEVAMAVVDGQVLFYGGRGGPGVSPLLLTFSAGRGSISSF